MIYTVRVRVGALYVSLLSLVPDSEFRVQRAQDFGLGFAHDFCGEASLGLGSWAHFPFQQTFLWKPPSFIHELVQ